VAEPNVLSGGSYTGAAVGSLFTQRRPCLTPLVMPHRWPLNTTESTMTALVAPGRSRTPVLTRRPDGMAPLPNHIFMSSAQA
jgi:hypothetical protein